MRNTRIQQTLIVIDCMGGRNFMMGNYCYTPLYRSWDAVSLTGEQFWLTEVNATSLPSERETQGQVDKLALRRGLLFVKAHPGLTLQRDVIKFFDFWGLERELFAGAGKGFFGKLPLPVILGLFVLICGTYAVVLFLAIFGMFLMPLADRRVHWLFFLIIAFICGMHTLSFGHSRYHLPLMPLLVVFAAAALMNLRVIWAQRRTRVFWAATACCAVLVGGWAWCTIAGDLDRYLGMVRSLS
jgi:hypothetical protein